MLKLDESLDLLTLLLETMLALLDTLLCCWIEWRRERGDKATAFKAGLEGCSELLGDMIEGENPLTLPLLADVARMDGRLEFACEETSITDGGEEPMLDMTRLLIRSATSLSSRL